MDLVHSIDDAHFELPLGTMTLHVRYVPFTYSHQKLMHEWPPHESYNFLYLPRHLKRRRPLGFAFINFVSPDAALAFFERWNGKHLKFHSESARPLYIREAERQGLFATLRHLKLNPAPQMSIERYRPVVIDGTTRLNFDRVLEDINLTEQDIIDDALIRAKAKARPCGGITPCPLPDDAPSSTAAGSSIASGSDIEESEEASEVDWTTLEQECTVIQQTNWVVKNTFLQFGAPKVCDSRRARSAPPTPVVPPAQNDAMISEGAVVAAAGHQGAHRHHRCRVSPVLFCALSVVAGAAADMRASERPLKYVWEFHRSFAHNATQAGHDGIFFAPSFGKVAPLVDLSSSLPPRNLYSGLVGGSMEEHTPLTSITSGRLVVVLLVLGIQHVRALRSTTRKPLVACRPGVSELTLLFLMMFLLVPAFAPELKSDMLGSLPLACALCSASAALVWKATHIARSSCQALRSFSVISYVLLFASGAQVLFVLVPYCSVSVDGYLMSKPQLGGQMLKPAFPLFWAAVVLAGCPIVAWAFARRHVLLLTSGGLREVMPNMQEGLGSTRVNWCLFLLAECLLDRTTLGAIGLAILCVPLCMARRFAVVHTKPVKSDPCVAFLGEWQPDQVGQRLAHDHATILSSVNVPCQAPKFPRTRQVCDVPATSRQSDSLPSATRPPKHPVVGQRSAAVSGTKAPSYAAGVRCPSEQPPIGQPSAEAPPSKPSGFLNRLGLKSAELGLKSEVESPTDGTKSSPSCLPQSRPGPPQALPPLTVLTEDMHIMALERMQREQRQLFQRIHQLEEAIPTSNCPEQEEELTLQLEAQLREIQEVHLQAVRDMQRLHREV